MPMKGLRLLARPATDADHHNIKAFLHTEGCSYQIATTDTLWIGKLLGEIVSVALLDQPSGAEVELEFLLVASHLRGKRIASVLLSELEKSLVSTKVRQLTAQANVLPSSFVEKNGFVADGARYVKYLE
jgi:hypothetical protein